MAAIDRRLAQINTDFVKIACELNTAYSEEQRNLREKTPGLYDDSASTMRTRAIIDLVSGLGTAGCSIAGVFFPATSTLGACVKAFGSEGHGLQLLGQAGDSFFQGKYTVIDGHIKMSEQQKDTLTRCKQSGEENIQSVSRALSEVVSAMRSLAS